MQYVRNLGGSVTKTWNALNPATLSGAIDVIVVEQPDGSLACSPFHVRFGKFSLLLPYEKKVEFTVNGEKRDFPMKLGEGGEAFFIFETYEDVPEEMLTSPLVSPAASPKSEPVGQDEPLQEPDFLDLRENAKRMHRKSMGPELLSPMAPERRTSSDLTEPTWQRPSIGVLPGGSASEDVLDKNSIAQTHMRTLSVSDKPELDQRPSSPPPLTAKEAHDRAVSLSVKLSTLDIKTQVTEEGNVMLDMAGYKATEDQALQAEIIARRILAEELEGNYDIGALIGADEDGNIWIYNSEIAKERAEREMTLKHLGMPTVLTSDAASDPGYHSDDGKSSTTGERRESISTLDGERVRRQSVSFAKTLRLTSDQLKSLNLKQGPNEMSFSVNRSTCPAFMFYWKYNEPIVISDIDGTITKSDALGHVLNMIGRDWTHPGVAKLYTNIVSNGYNILYLTSRSVGQADTTRTYLKGVIQEKYRLPNGPVIMSPDRTMAALKREIYLRKPEVFKMACLRDIRELFLPVTSPFYAGFGNRLTDALSYRSVNIPSNRIFTINSNAEVSLDLLTLTKYKSSYVSMRELVDHFFPPLNLLIKDGGEEFTDFTYWRDKPLEIDDFSASDSDSLGEGSIYEDELNDSFAGSVNGSIPDEMIDSYIEGSIGEAIGTQTDELNLDNADEDEVEDQDEPEADINVLPEGIHISHFPVEQKFNGGISRIG